MLKPGITRFLLAALVVLFHISRFVFLGRFAVCSFFTLSGYWIALMFSNKYSKKAHPLKVFYTSRIWRLLPVFYTFTILGFAIWLLVDHSVIQQIIDLGLSDKVVFGISNITLLGYYSLPKIDILTPAWSLDIEMQFYLLFPLLFYISRNNYKVLIWLFFVMMAVSFYLCAGYNTYWVNNSLPTYLYFFVLGMIIFFKKWRFNANSEKICLAIFVILVGLQYIIPYSQTHYKQIGSMYYVTLSLVLVLLAVPTLANSVQVLSDKRDKFWGELSFLIYLGHWVLIRPYGVLSQNASSIMHVLYTALYLLCTMGLATAIYWLVDRPIEKLRHKWINNQA